MPRQSPEHRIERESTTAFLAAVPANWEVRDVAPDLGVDLMVEVFDGDGLATGTMFGVQLKASSTARSSTQRLLRLSHKHHRYYQSLQVPLLLVRYSSESSKIWVRWHHSFDPGLADQVNKKTVTFRFTVDDQLTPELAKRIQRDAMRIRLLRSSQCPAVIGFSAAHRVPNLSDQRWRQITHILDRYLKPFECFIRQGSSFDDTCMGDVCVFPDKVVVSLATLSTVTLHLHSRDLERLESILPECFVFGAGATIAQAGLPGIGLKVLMQYLLSPNSQDVDCFIGSAGLLLRRPQFHDDLRFFLNHSGTSLRAGLGLQVLCHLPLFHVPGFSETELKSLVLRLHALRQELVENDALLSGILCYHLGRVAIGDRCGDSAVALLQEAEQRFPAISDTPFFAGDLGTAHYLCGNITEASAWYEKQTGKYYFPQYDVMNGHCRLLLGDLDGAQRCLKNVRSTTPRFGPWVVLLAKAIDWLASTRGVSGDSDISICGTGGPPGENTVTRTPPSSASADPVPIENTAAAWERMASQAANEGDWHRAFHVQLLCSLSRVRDADSWEKTVVYARQYTGSDRHEEVFASLAAAYQMVGDELIEAAERFAQKHIPEDQVDGFVRGQAEAGRMMAPKEPEIRRDVVLLNRRGEMLALMAEGHTLTVYREKPGDPTSEK